MCHLTGWTWDYVENTLTVPRLYHLRKEWEINPPMPLLFAAWLGIKKEKQGTHEELIDTLKAASK